MADRIFPNKFQESGIDSELVFTGINWDTFNERLAKVMDGEGDEKKKVPHELMEALNDKYPEEFDEEAESNDREGGKKWAAYAEDEDEEDMEDEDESEASVSEVLDSAEVQSDINLSVASDNVEVEAVASLRSRLQDWVSETILKR